MLQPSLAAEQGLRSYLSSELGVDQQLFGDGDGDIPSRKNIGHRSLNLYGPRRNLDLSQKAGIEVADAPAVSKLADVVIPRSEIVEIEVRIVLVVEQNGR